MDEKFRGYFQEQVQTFEGSLVARRHFLFGGEEQALSGAAVQEGLDVGRQAAETRGLELREDAQFLIGILARELVANPVAAVTPEDAQNLPAILKEDIATIVEQAGETANDREVSAHAVIDGLSSSWDRLRSSNLRVWDRHSGLADEKKSSPGERGPEEFGPSA